MPLAQGLTDIWNRKVDNDNAEILRERSIREAKEKEINIKRFETEYVEKYWTKANEGNQEAQMILYYASFHLQCTEIYYSQREKWFNEAIDNNNLDALVQKVSWPNEVTNKERLDYLEHAAVYGSLDAMVMLGDYYDVKSGGNNPEMAFNFYTLGAEKGSPNAMYYLGMIHKYGTTHPKVGNKFYIKYENKIDKNKAFEWFSKSIIAGENHERSIFQTNSQYHQGSTFDPNVYEELSYFHKKGEILDLDKEKAEFFKNLPQVEYKGPHHYYK